MTDERDPTAVWARCDRVLAGEHPRARDPRATLEALAARAPTLEDSDRYGGGALAERLKTRVASLLGKEAALWLPSGTMAQQIALRIHANRAGMRTVAFHPHCHLDVHEERGYERLHGLHAALLGDRDRPLEPSDFEAVHEPLAAVLVELPQRDLGGTLPSWDDLRALCDSRARATRRFTSTARASGSRPVLRTAAQRDRHALRHGLRLVLQGPRRAGGLRARRAAGADRRGARLAGASRRSPLQRLPAVARGRARA